MKLTKSERAWVLYDWANSVYATIMVAAVFPIFFSSVCAEAGQQGDFWWGVGTSISTLLLAALAPLIGAIADYRGYKKKLFVLCFSVGLLFTLFSAFVGSWQLMLIGYCISHLGWSGANLVYDSFLTDVTTPDRMDRLSSLGFSMGYIGGSTIPFAMSILLIMMGEKVGIDATMAVKLSLIITVLWWGLFSIPFLKRVEQKHGQEIPKKNAVKDVFNNIFSTFKNIMRDKSMFYFILAYFFYIDGVNTVINMATSYGTTLGLDSGKMILALMLTQLVAFPCAILFGRISSRIGSIQAIVGAICVYILICVLGFYMGFGLEEATLTMGQAELIFWIVAVLVGTVQGGIQAISRSHFGKLVPAEKSGEYFGFFEIFGKFAAVLGPSLYALTLGATGRSSMSILSVIALFVVALVIIFAGRKHLFK